VCMKGPPKTTGHGVRSTTDQAKIVGSQAKLPVRKTDAKERMHNQTEGSCVHLQE
jgi:hypothetical protein